MARIRRGGYILVTWRGDHWPRHVHVYRDGRLVLKFDLDHGQVLTGLPDRYLMELIRQLQREGIL